MKKSKEARVIKAQSEIGGVMFSAEIEKALLNRPQKKVYVKIMARPQNISADAVKVGQMMVDLNECRVENIVENSRGPEIKYEDVIRFHMQQQLKLLYGDCRPNLNIL